MAIEVAQVDEEMFATDTEAEVADSMAPNILVLGLGNTLLGDEGVGIRLIERLRADPVSEAADLIDGGTLSFSLLPLVEAADAMLVADAADLGEAAGTVRIFEGEAMDRFLASARRRSVHEVGLSDLLDMARLLDCMPQRRALLCIQPLTIAWGEALSPPVAGTFDVAVAQAADLLRRWRNP